MFVLARNDESMKAALTNSVNRKSGPLDDGLAYLSSSRHLVSGCKGTNFVSLVGWTTVSGNNRIGEEIVTYADAGKAKDAKEEYDKFVAAGKLPAFLKVPGIRVIDKKAYVSGPKFVRRSEVEIDPDKVKGIGFTGFGF
jgi:hypothetical protein